jgi:hypothetical protein
MVYCSHSTHTLDDAHGLAHWLTVAHSSIFIHIFYACGLNDHGLNALIFMFNVLMV